MHSDKLNRSFSFLDKATKIASKNKLNNFSTIGYRGLANVYLKKNMLDSALYYSTKSLDIGKKLGDKRIITLSLIVLGNVYFENKNINKAIECGKECFNLINDNTKGLSLIRGASNVLYKGYKAKNDTKTALKYFERYNKARDSIRNKQLLFKSAITELELNHEKRLVTLQEEKKKQEIITEQEKRNFWLIGFLIISVLSFIFLVVYSKLRKSKLKSQLELASQTKINNIKSVFIENLAHEIRTPVAISSGYLNLMNKYLLNPDKLKKYINLSLKSNEVIVNRADEFLSIVKYQKGYKLESEITKKDLPNFIYALMLSFVANAEIKQISIFYKKNIEGSILVNYDYNKLEKILSNLITNALKYSYSNSSIYLDVEITNNELNFKIKDEGVGIAVSEQDLVFTRFYQSKDNKISGGLGIGLAYVKELVNSLSGEISLKSAKNKGSTFTVNLPLQEINFDATTFINNRDYLRLTEENLVVASNNNNLPKALLVDDNIEMVTYLKEILGNYLDCDLAFNGIEALKKIRDNNYHIVISDLRMPEINGIELKEELNKDKKLADIPFIVITANSLLSFNQLLGTNLGVNDYLVKPFIDSELITRVNNLLENNALRINALKSSKEDFNQELIINGTINNLLNKINSYVIENLDNTTFSVDDLAEYCNYSKRNLSRVIKSKTGLTPIQIILEIRLIKAYELIKSRKYTSIKEVIFSVGLTNRSYFNKVFLKRFGIRPSELLK